MQPAAWLRALLLAGLCLCPAPASAQTSGPPIELAFPAACAIGRTCFIQNYVDNDPGPGARDYACGSATYDGHTGVDIRLLSVAEARRGVPVLAAASGTVKAVRDGETDTLLRERNREDVAGRECGNGVVIEHGGGWETQYCHLRKDSIAVAKGKSVSRGELLGLIGYSGFADFAHVHFAVRRAGRVVDPFLYPGAPEACVPEAGKAPGLWDAATRSAIGYETGRIIEAGFAAHAPTLLDLEHGAVSVPDARSAQLLFYVRALNLRAQDRIRIEVAGPAGVRIEHFTPPLDRSKAVYSAFAGKRRPGEAWSAGLYRGSATLVREGRAASTLSAELHLMP